MTTTRQPIHSDDGMRAMPFYIVVDRSGSMSGEPIAGANRIVPSICRYLSGDPTAADCAHISVISFDTSATVDVALTSVANLIENERFPTLSAGGGTSFAAPLSMLVPTIQKDIERLKAQGFKTLRPVVFPVTDGNDNAGGWHEALHNLTHYDRETNLGFPYYPQIVPFGFGAADTASLDRLVWPKVPTETYTPRYYMATGADIAAIMNTIIAGLSWSIMNAAKAASGGQWVNAAPPAAALGANSPLVAHDASPFPDGAVL